MNVLHTIYDWYDGPRSGAAEFDGATYWYRSVYLDSKEWDPDEDRFELTPLSKDAAAWELERAVIFQRWDKARREGLVQWRDGDDESFGALPKEMHRYRELNENISSYLAQTAPTHLVRATFPEPERVQWSLIRKLSGAEQTAARDRAKSAAREQ